MPKYQFHIRLWNNVDKTLPFLGQKLGPNQPIPPSKDHFLKLHVRFALSAQNHMEKWSHLAF